jgi:hypothetical protein
MRSTAPKTTVRVPRFFFICGPQAGADPSFGAGRFKEALRHALPVEDCCEESHAFAPASGLSAIYDRLFPARERAIG